MTVYKVFEKINVGFNTKDWYEIYNTTYKNNAVSYVRDLLAQRPDAVLSVVKVEETEIPIADLINE